jgi:predicted membrane protein
VFNVSNCKGSNTKCLGVAAISNSMQGQRDTKFDNVPINISLYLMLCLVYDVVYERLKLQTYINIAGIFTFIILLAIMYILCWSSLRKINYIVTNIYCIWQEYGVESCTVSVTTLAYGSLRVGNNLRVSILLLLNTMTHKFSKNQGSTSKFKDPDRWNEGCSILRTHKY